MIIQFNVSFSKFVSCFFSSFKGKLSTTISILSILLKDMTNFTAEFMKCYVFDILYVHKSQGL